MVNTGDFIKRLEKILEYYSLNASSFADKIGVQRSSLSHLLSGRNKPSLDFILKVLEQFPDIDLYWILNGKGQFPNTNEAPLPQSHSTETVLRTETSTTPMTENSSENDFLPNSNKNTTAEKSTNNVVERFSSEIEQIVVFYKNGTFKIYTS